MPLQQPDLCILLFCSWPGGRWTLPVLTGMVTGQSQVTRPASQYCHAAAYTSLIHFNAGNFYFSLNIFKGFSKLTSEQLWFFGCCFLCNFLSEFLLSCSQCESEEEGSQERPAGPRCLPPRHAHSALLALVGHGTHTPHLRPRGRVKVYWRWLSHYLHLWELVLAGRWRRPSVQQYCGPAPGTATPARPASPNLS